MLRRIVGFSVDDAGEHVAWLDCLHRRHVRHRPPFEPRPWVLDEALREQRIGTEIDCGRCDQSELPEGLVLLRTAGPFDAGSLPPGLRRSHRTAKGVWAVLHVLGGEVEYRMEGTRETLRAGESRAIPPEVAHEVKLGAGAEITIELLGRPRSGPSRQ